MRMKMKGMMRGIAFFVLVRYVLGTGCSLSFGWYIVLGLMNRLCL